eukprot:scaffold6352_cov200-Isochrysis_galbana.AAC.6
MRSDEGGRRSCTRSCMSRRGMLRASAADTREPAAERRSKSRVSSQRQTSAYPGVNSPSATGSPPAVPFHAYCSSRYRIMLTSAEPSARMLKPCASLARDGSTPGCVERRSKSLVEPLFSKPIPRNVGTHTEAAAAPPPGGPKHALPATGARPHRDDR